MILQKLFYGVVAALLVSSSSAFAFVTVIDVQERWSSQVVTVTSPQDYSFGKLLGQSASYRGLPGEAAALLKKMAEQELPAQLTSYDLEINEKTGTISLIVSVQGFGGPDHSYFILKRSGN